LFDFEIDVIFVKGLAVKMEIAAMGNGTFGRHLSSQRRADIFSASAVEIS